MKHMLIKASFGMFALACSQAVLAAPHHATPTAETVCDFSGQWIIDYHAITWIQPPTPENCEDTAFNGDSCGNPAIGVFTYDNANDAINLIENGVPSPGFPDCDTTGNPNLQAIQALQSPDYKISGSFVSPTQTPGETVWLATKPLAPWDDGRAPACVNKQTVGDYRATSVTIPVEPCDPQGEALTPGYWANWSSCSGGKQFERAARNGNPTLDENLPQTVGLVLVDDCVTGYRILSGQYIDDGENAQSDAAYILARAQLAYLLNTTKTPPSYSCPLAEQASADAQTLLAGIGFDGVSDFLIDPSPLREEALFLKDILDAYNNNELDVLACALP
jgi:hypothetical protein